MAFLEYAKERNDYKFPIFTARPCVCFGFVSLKPNAINLRNVPQNCVLDHKLSSGKEHQWNIVSMLRF